jgi:starch-binding outer membrane protein, SusD/RagB family
MKHNRYKINTKILSIIIVLIIGLSACMDDLDKLPTNGIKSNDQFNSVIGYKQGLVSVYSNLAYGDFLRPYWMMQEYTTDEAVSTWNDNGDGIYHQ